MVNKLNYKKKNSNISSKTKILSIRTFSSKETEKLGIKIAQEIIKKLRIKCVIFFGPFGAGKTTMIKGIITGLTGRKDISSPSFIIVNEYAKDKLPVYHFDFYRLKNSDELESFGFKEYLNKGVVLVEWPEAAIKKLPKESLKIRMEFIDLNSRKITITLPEKK
ncbi:MAG: tRNA (adenosine(37)-N6)-threonylcarbamoyltransferase complex ATPase subunit type 1 TsaE [Candidatus Omnitrophica bacterium]|nr:tRNA (adenosine(37)-N6)-threonylcarbamoyltransferase complex ATPase subunit type 1 TsaE [Candidatus Omnitrophota bacterium]